MLDRVPRSKGTPQGCVYDAWGKVLGYLHDIYSIYARAVDKEVLELDGFIKNLNEMTKDSSAKLAHLSKTLTAHSEKIVKLETQRINLEREIQDKQQELTRIKYELALEQTTRDSLKSSMLAKDDVDQLIEHNLLDLSIIVGPDAVLKVAHIKMMDANVMCQEWKQMHKLQAPKPPPEE